MISGGARQQQRHGRRELRTDVSPFPQSERETGGARPAVDRAMDRTCARAHIARTGKCIALQQDLRNAAKADLQMEAAGQVLLGEGSSG